MGKQKRIETQVPEAMIQNIQSFLSAKEAARTTVLSKSWYAAWLTRPNLDFAERDFPILGYDIQIIRTESPFVKFVEKTMRRYDELNRKIHSFRLRMNGFSSHAEWNISLAKEMIAKAMKLGATDLDIEQSTFVLPHEVLESQTLVRLSFTRGAIDLQDRKVSCSRLKSLNLSRVRIDGNNLWDNILICPLIEELILFACLSKNDDSRVYRNRMLVLKPAGFCVDHLYDFHRMRVLFLDKAEIGDWFFHDVSKFPCLKELTLNHCSGHKEIQICSNSLECISFNTRLWILRFKLVVPRIRKFKFTGNCVPTLSFKTTSKEWESDIFIGDTLNFHVEKTSWFHKLREFLLELSPSKISLSLKINIILPNTSISFKEGCDDYADAGGIIPRVEKLTLLINAPFSVHYAILEDLFWTCRPNFIILYWLPYSPLPPLHYFPYYFFDKESEENNDFTKLLCNMLKKKVSDHENRNMSALPLHGLKDVYVDFFEDDVVAGRRPLPWKTLLEASANSGNIKIEVCLQLIWGETF